MTVRNWITKLLRLRTKLRMSSMYLREIKEIITIYMLIVTNTDMTYKEVKYGLGNVSVGDYQPINDSEDVCKYLSKHIGENVDYDIAFKEIS